MVYVYFDYKAQQTQTVTHVARLLLKQLLAQSHGLSPELEALYETSTQECYDPDLPTLMWHLAWYSERFPVYAVFDALDECNETQLDDMILFFTELQKISYRLLVSCRPHLQNLSNQLRDPITFEIEANEYDLRNYVTYRLEKEKNRNVALEQKCQDLVKNVQGM